MAKTKSFNKLPKAVASNMSTTKMISQSKSGCVVKTSRFVVPATQNAAGLSCSAIAVDPFGTAITTPSVNNIAGGYEFYRVRSLSVTIVPVGGFTSPGTVAVAFVNNPEIMVYNLSQDAASRYSTLQSQDGAVLFPVSSGGTKVYRSTRVRSRPWFQCNYAVTSTIDDFDRSVHSQLLLGYLTTPSTAAPFQYVVNVTFEFSGLGRSSTTTFMSITDMARYPFGEEDDVEYPTSVELYRRNGGTRLYVPKPPPKPPSVG